MNSNQENIIIRRILVALDVSPPSLAALEAAANLAGQLHAELVGLYVEDVNLLKLAQFPFASEIRYPRATILKLDTTSMETDLRRVAKQARALLRESAERRNLPWAFHVVRGVVPDELLAAANAADLLVLGNMSRRLVRTSGVGSTAETAVTRTRRPVLLLHSHLDLKRPVLLIYDGSSAARLALTIAGALCQISETLLVLIWAEDDQADQAYRREIIDRLQNSNVDVKFGRLRDSETAATILSGSDFGLIVIGDAEKEPSSSIIRSLLLELDYPVLIVR